jgi:membrane protease YdiL (CAAX protease family)
MNKNNKGILAYIFLSLGWAYTFWLVAVLVSLRDPAWPGIRILHFVGGVSPLVAAIYTVIKMRSWKDFLRRCVRFSGFFPWVWLIVLSPVLIALIVSFLAKGTVDLSQEFLSQGVLYALFLFFFGPLPEELGWRGVLFDLSATQSVIKAQVLTGLVWFAWHLPLFFIPGTYQQGVGFATTGFLFWTVGLLLQSVIMGYLYILSNQSIASAVLFHYFVNLAGEAFEKNTSTEVLTLAFYLVVALGLGLAYYIKRGKR